MIKDLVVNLTGHAEDVAADYAILMGKAYGAHVVGVASGTCPDGAPAMVLTIAWPASGLGAAAAARAVAGAPARILEVMEIAAYVSDGVTWLGQRSLSRGEVIQPMVGPLADTGTAAPGFRLEYLDGRGTPAVEPGEVGSIVATLRGITSRPVWNARVDRPVVDTIALVSRIALRNTVRP